MAETNKIRTVETYSPEDILSIEVDFSASQYIELPKVLNSDQLQYPFDTKLLPFNPDTVKYRIFGELLSGVRRCYRRRVTLEKKNQDSPSRFMDFFRDHCLHPTLEVFNQMKHPELEVIQYTEEVVIEGAMSRFILWESSGQLLFPVLFVLAPGTLDASLWRSAGISTSPPYNISHAILSKLESLLPADGESIAILSDHRTSIILQRIPSKDDNTRIFHCEVIEQPDPKERTNRLVLAACIKMRLPLRCLYDNVQTGRSPRGALNDPTLPLLSDEEVFATKKRLSDFDGYTLRRDRQRAKQFFRWKEHVLKEALSRECIPGDILSALTNELNKHRTPLRNRHPLLPLPPHTAAHLDQFSRPFSPAFAKMLGCSQKFEVRLTKTLKRAEEGSGLTAVYACQLLTIDGQPVEDGSSPDLCLKIFDDRLFRDKEPKKDESPLGIWFPTWTTSEDMVRKEEAVYQRLEHAQGSVIPRYYGSHLFTLPDGYLAFGILMEYVQGGDPINGELKDVSTDAKIAFIQSARHAVRVFEYADVSQRDWDSSQIISSPAPKSSCAPPGSRYCVFVDFTYTVQSDAAYDSDFWDDYGEVLEILCHPAVGLSKELLRLHYEKREKWNYYLTDPLDDNRVLSI